MRKRTGFAEPVDRIRELVGGVATIFAGDTRIAIPLPTKDGARAIGTKLTSPAVIDAVLKQANPIAARR